jgi:hypothetical protein
MGTTERKHRPSLLGRLFRKRENNSPRRLEFNTEALQLHLDGDWLEVPDDEPERFMFASDEKRTGIIISTMLRRTPRGQLLEAAESFANARRKAELSFPGRTVTFGDNWTELRDNGELGHVAYAAYDDLGNIFRFMGWVTEAKLISLWVSTETTDNAFSKRVFDEVFAGFRFYVP